MDLSRRSLKNISPNQVTVPGEEIFELPEKVLQFGSGVLLRGLPDYFIDEANRNGVFNGRIVIVKTTSGGDLNAFDRQDSLYTLCTRGIVNGKKIAENVISSSISRVLTAENDWKAILACAYNIEIKVIISNTTEIGIELVKESIHLSPPKSYPAKLAAFLYQRFKAFNGSRESGFIIIPTELIPDNGEKLRKIVLELAHFNDLEDAFIAWLQQGNNFCNSLVDRIVTGMPSEDVRAGIEQELGYTDDLLTVNEVYGLWAIEGNAHVRSVLTFGEVNEGVKIEPDIDLHRELKLRLLNGTHTLSCGVAFFAKCKTVKHAMENEILSGFIHDLMKNEIGPSISHTIDQSIKDIFIVNVLDRFQNPHINHLWKSITLNYTSKMKMRCIPLLINFSRNNGSVPFLFAFGFAAYLRFMKGVIQKDNDFFGECDDVHYLIQDDMAEYFFYVWQQPGIDNLVKDVLKNSSIWGVDLTLIPDFELTVTEYLKMILEDGMKAALEKVYTGKFLAQ